MQDETEFSYPRPNLIVSRRGYSVDVARSAVRYEEAGRAMEIFSENGSLDLTRRLPSGVETCEVGSGTRSLS